MTMFSNLDERTRRVIEKYDRIAEEYATKTAGSASQEDIRKFMELLPTTPKIADVGCAAGRDCKIFSDRGVDCIGVDLSEGLLDVARRTYPEIEFIHADARDLPFSDAYLDGVWAHGLLHEMERFDMPIVLKEIERVLKPSGILYVRTKMGEGSVTTQDIMSVGEERDVTLLSPQDVERLLSDLALEKIELSTSKSKSRDLYWISAFYRKQTFS